MSDLAEQKTALRQQALAMREFLAQNFPGLDTFMRIHIENWPVFQNAGDVLLYHPFRGEIDLLPLCEKFPEKRWYLPRVQKRDLKFFRYRPGDALETHAYGMQEPLKTAKPIGLLDSGALILLPALMADHAGYRLGYGQGFYDRFLASLGDDRTDIYTAVVVPAMQMTEALPRQPWDKPSRAVVSDTGIQEVKA